jgi:3'-phosphoadenosine 5'-phosphosulfate sulfotransferase (PAPS reductase)/FAD synthetase
LVALSGGKDSTALALRLAEVEPRDYIYFCSPTGDELPDMVEHWNRLECILGKPIRKLSNRTLDFWIKEQGALPNFRMRWCTRILKIEPCRAFMKGLGECVLYVGLRADEPEREGVIYGGQTTERYPMREWGWGLRDVKEYLVQRGVTVPTRTDCARCYGQRIGEWWDLWKNHPAIFADAEGQEVEHRHTFRSAHRDTWPASLADLRVKFEAGHRPPGARVQLPLFDDNEPESGCRVCKL